MTATFEHSHTNLDGDFESFTCFSCCSPSASPFAFRCFRDEESYCQICSLPPYDSASCPKGHPLLFDNTYRCTDDEKFRCHRCKAPGKGQRWNCFDCNFSLCKACRPQKGMEGKCWELRVARKDKECGFCHKPKIEAGSFECKCWYCGFTVCPGCFRPDALRKLANMFCFMMSIRKLSSERKTIKLKMIRALMRVGFPIEVIDINGGGYGHYASNVGGRAGKRWNKIMDIVNLGKQNTALSVISLSTTVHSP